MIFSRLWQVGEKSEQQPLWLLATQLGAQCTTTLDSTVTHLVTDTKFTEKVLARPSDSVRVSNETSSNPWKLTWMQGGHSAN